MSALFRIRRAECLNEVTKLLHTSLEPYLFKVRDKATIEGIKSTIDNIIENVLENNGYLFGGIKAEYPDNMLYEVSTVSIIFTDTLTDATLTVQCKI
jgi:hypothetical protein